VTQERLHFGKEGEKAAVKFLKKRGYRIIEKNYRNKSGEIDIVAEQDQVLVFVEVMSGADAESGEPLEAFTPQKKRKIGQVAKGVHDPAPDRKPRLPVRCGRHQRRSQLTQNLENRTRPRRLPALMALQNISLAG
jgi:Holliday junction resolvase-like predicted endonuclease